MPCSLLRSVLCPSLLCPSLALLAATVVPAQEWSVAGSGDDAHDGKTADQAFRTLAKAATVVQPGDTVLIGDGVYSNIEPAAAIVVMTTSGTPSAWITWKARDGQHPVLHPTGWSGILVHASYQRISGLTVSGDNDALTLVEALADTKSEKADAKFNTNGIFVEGRKLKLKPHHVVIANCEVGKCPGGGITAIEADYITVEDCRVHDNAWYMRFAGSGITTLDGWSCDDDPGYHTVIQRNVVWNNRCLVPWSKLNRHSDGNGILLDVTDQEAGAANAAADSATLAANTGDGQQRRPEWKGRSLVANNVSCGNGGSGIHAFRTCRADIVNNTTAMNGSVVGYPEIFANSCDDVNILNNVMIPRPGAKVNSNHKNSHVNWDYNLYAAGITEISGPHDIVADPQFVNFAIDQGIANLRLRPGSPGMGSAGPDLVQSTDVTGAPRPTGVPGDRGAYRGAPADSAH